MHAPRLGKIIHFHTGTHKTGSTALQAFFSANQASLATHGINYAFPLGADEHMGNGQTSFEAINGLTPNDPHIGAILDCYLGDRDMAICSSEDFTRWGEREWRAIIAACQSRGIHIIAITFVRDIGPYYSSLHGQLSRCGETQERFEAFCSRDQYYPVLHSLRYMLDLLGRESVLVIHYESAKNDLGSAILDVLGLPYASFNHTPVQRVVNRSLTEYEKRLLSDLNHATGSQYSYEFSNTLVRKWPHLAGASALSQNTTSELSARHEADIQWINGTFFCGLPILRICSDQDGRVAANEQVTEADISREAFTWAVGKLGAAADAAIRLVTSRVLSIDWENAAHPDIPVDFDPVAYLLQNIDVLKAGSPPYKHFILSGQKEGRQWTWRGR